MSVSLHPPTASDKKLSIFSQTFKSEVSAAWRIVPLHLCQRPRKSSSLRKHRIHRAASSMILLWGPSAKENFSVHNKFNCFCFLFFFFKDYGCVCFHFQASVHLNPFPTWKSFSRRRNLFIHHTEHQVCATTYKIILNKIYADLMFAAMYDTA